MTPTKLTTSKGTFLAFEVNTSNVLLATLSLPESLYDTEVINTTSRITEEQAADSIVETCSELRSSTITRNRWLNYMYKKGSDEAFCKTALECLHSLLKANGLDASKEYLILKVK